MSFKIGIRIKGKKRFSYTGISVRFPSKESAEAYALTIRRTHAVDGTKVVWSDEPTWPNNRIPGESM